MVRDGLVTSPPEKPKEDESGYLTWEAENSLVIVLLVNSMEQKIGRNYLSYKTAKKVWDLAAAMYSDLGNSS